MSEKIGSFDTDSQPADHEIEVNPEKLEASREVSSQEYVVVLERVLTRPKREQCLDRMRDLLGNYLWIPAGVYPVGGNNKIKITLHFPSHTSEVEWGKW
ncbi:MAG: hypothetical protein NTY30_02915 [Candidatus Berkelbacteria bacterium]|nr:hypothetical protein [Candidatus Berkelbacteria bacterium]